MMTSLFALVLVIIIAGTAVLPLQVLKAQNMTIKMYYNATCADEVNSNVIANIAREMTTYDITELIRCMCALGFLSTASHNP